MAVLIESMAVLNCNSYAGQNFTKGIKIKEDGHVLQRFAAIWACPANPLVTVPVAQEEDSNVFFHNTSQFLIAL